nr:aldehyde dehydrogenase family protein [Amycolatopsis sp. GM8]
MRNQNQLTELIVGENGKSRTDARGDVAFAAEFFRWYAEQAVRPNGHYGPSPAGGTRTVVTQRPSASPHWSRGGNFPAAMITRKAWPAPAIAWRSPKPACPTTWSTS